MSLASAIEAGRAVIMLGMPTDEVEKSLLKLQKRAEVIGSKFKAVGDVGLKAGATLSAAFGAAASTFANAGTKLEQMAVRTGESVSNLSALSYAAAQSGAEFDDILGAAEELNIRLGEAAREGTGPLAETFAKLGLDVQELIDMPLPERLATVGDALRRLPDNAAIGFAADEIFGGDAFRILPLLTSDIGELTREAERLGVVMSTQDAASAAELSTAITKLVEQVKAMALQVGAAVAGPLTEWLGKSQETIKSTIDWIKENRTLIVLVAKVGVGLAAVGAAAYAIGTAFTVAATAVGVFRIAMLLATSHPIIAALALIAAAIMAIAIAFGFATDGSEELRRDLERINAANDATERAEQTRGDRRQSREALEAAATAERQKAELAMEEQIAEVRAEERAAMAAAATAMASGSSAMDGSDSDWASNYDGSEMEKAIKAEEEFKASTSRPTSPVAIFDTRFAAMQFGGGNRTEELLEKIEKNTKPRNEDQFGLPVE